MDFASALLQTLNSPDLTYKNKLVLVDNVFKSSEYYFHHKEALLIKWLLDNLNDNSGWNVLINWMNSGYFKELTRNDIQRDDAAEIIEKLFIVLSDKESFKEIHSDALMLLFENTAFILYFKQNLDDYCKMIHVLSTKINLVSFWTNPLIYEKIFNKTILNEEKFCKKFFSILTDLTSLLIKFENNEIIYNELCKIVQLCCFNKKHNCFDTYLNTFFSDSSNEKQLLPKVLLKYLSSAYSLNELVAARNFSLIFDSFCKSFSDFQLIFKFFIILLDGIGFNLNPTITLRRSLKIDPNELDLSKSLVILLDIYRIFCRSKIDLKCQINDVSASTIIQDLLQLLMNVTASDDVTFEIIILTFSIHPIIVESITNEVIVYSLLGSNHQDNMYEKCLISLLDVYAKLHCIQTLISKLITTVKSALEGENFLEDKFSFKGINSKMETDDIKYKIENMLSEKFLNRLSQYIITLPNWQIINLIKTVLHHLNVFVNDLSKDVYDDNKLIYVEILSSLLCTILCSIRISEQSGAATVTTKIVKCFEELREILGNYGTALLHFEHNHILMKTFLNICYYWGESYIILKYYSINDEVPIKFALDSDYTACNVTYLHSYLSVKQWCLISERITNFGETICKLLLKKISLQKLKAVQLFEANFNNEIITNILKSVTSNLEESWKNIINAQEVLTALSANKDTANILNLVECIISADLKNEGVKPNCIMNNSTFINTINFVTMKKIFKLCNNSQCLSSKAFKTIRTELFLYNENDEDCLNQMKNILTLDQFSDSNFKVKLKGFLNIFIKYPIIKSCTQVQKIFLLYLFALHNDICQSSSMEESKILCENIIIGLLQHIKFKLLEIFDGTYLVTCITTNFNQFEDILFYTIENIFHDDVSIQMFSPVVNQLKNNLDNNAYLVCSNIVLKTIYKLKKNKLTPSTKNIVNEYKEKLSNKIIKLIIKTKPTSYTVESYALVLRNCLDTNDSNALPNLLQLLDVYLEYTLENELQDNCKGKISLLLSILHHKSQIESFNDTSLLKIWQKLINLETEIEDFEEYSQLVVLIFEHIPFNDFQNIVSQLLSTTETFINDENCHNICKQLKIWESILACSFNQKKITVWLKALEGLLKILFTLSEKYANNEELVGAITDFQKKLIQATQLHLTPTMIDLIILNVSVLIRSDNKDTCYIITICITILEILLKFRKALVMDRLPSYLQQYRLVLKSLCSQSNTELNLDPNNLQKITECAHHFEKLTILFVGCQKDMARISMYLIADILQQYEKVTFCSKVKMHLNNCIYNLISLCDQHAISFLMRVLSSASTEMFKVMYEQYNKFYRFTGKI